MTNLSVGMGAALTAQAQSQGQDRWEHEVSSYTMDEVHHYIKDDNWQRFRLSLKGISTMGKLAKLRMYRAGHGGNEIGRKYRVQIDNYINALKRGGQLDMNCKVIK